MRGLLLFLFLQFSIGASASEFEGTLISNGNELYSALNKIIKDSTDAPEMQNMRFGNLVGYFEATMSQYRYIRVCDGGDIPRLSLKQSWLITKNWMEKNPDKWGLPPWLIITSSHNDSWPCILEITKEENPTTDSVPTNRVVDAIKNNAFLSHWKKENLELWERAVEVDNELKALAKYSSYSLDDRFDLAVRQVIEGLHSEIRAAHDKNDKSEAERLWVLMENAYP